MGGAVPSDFKGLAFKKTPPFPILDLFMETLKRSWKFNECLSYHFPKGPLISFWRINSTYVGFHEQIETVAINQYVNTLSFCKHFTLISSVANLKLMQFFTFWIKKGHFLLKKTPLKCKVGFFHFLFDKKSSDLTTSSDGITWQSL